MNHSDQHIAIYNYQSPMGELILGSYNDALILCDWKYRNMRQTIDARIQKGLSALYIEQETDIIVETMGQLKAYFRGERKAFDLPLQPVGTDFQLKVWQALMQIPYGETVSYIQLSKSLGNEKAIRAVASANGSNAISIIIPCHRVIGSDGKLTGYAGGLNTKRKLLLLESQGSQKNELPLF